MSDQPKVSVKGRGILRHALGLSRSATAYRNHYVAGPGHDCMPELLLLESGGLIERVPTPSFYASEDIVFRVTPAGIEAVTHDQPKVSERMWKLVNAAISAEVGLNLDPDSPHRFIESTAAKNLLLSAIVEIEQRAETLEFLASVVRDHYADIVFPEAEDSTNATASDWVTCAINELGNQHKRAEKWKEVAVAEARLHIARNSLRIGVGMRSELIKRAESRVRAAITALGDEWDRAVKGEE